MKVNSTACSSQSSALEAELARNAKKPALPTAASHQPVAAAAEVCSRSKKESRKPLKSSYIPCTLLDSSSVVVVAACDGRRERERGREGSKVKP